MNRTRAGHHTRGIPALNPGAATLVPCARRRDHAHGSPERTMNPPRRISGAHHRPPVMRLRHRNLETNAATSAYQSTYWSGGTGLKPLDGSYLRCFAYGGDVMQTVARNSPKSLPITANSRQSPQISRCFPIAQTSTTQRCDCGTPQSRNELLFSPGRALRVARGGQARPTRPPDQ